MANSNWQKSYFSYKTGSTFPAILCLPRRQFAWNAKPYFSGKNKKNISKGCLLKILPSILFCLCWGFTAQSTQWDNVDWLIVLGFNDTSTLEGHFVSSPREREKRDRRESRGDEREGQGRKKNRNESEESEEIKTFPLYPYPLQG